MEFSLVTTQSISIEWSMHVVSRIYITASKGYDETATMSWKHFVRKKVFEGTLVDCSLKRSNKNSISKVLIQKSST